LFILFLLIMMPLATTELGVDSWITEFMAGEMGRLGLAAGWVLVYTSAIMMVLRFFAGPIVERMTPLGLLAASAALASIGLFALSAATGATILLAATLYGVGKTFFWPTTLGVVAEQFPKGGALTLNAVAGVGLLAVGIVGAPFLGYVQDRAIDGNLFTTAPVLHEQVMEPKMGLFGEYEALDLNAVETATPEERQLIDDVQERSTKDALRTVAVLPILMLAFYIGLILYFRGKGGYKPVELAERKEAEDAAAPV
ncbi:MAG: hypothetical protein WD205_10080, partial [Rhodothermales bacterium]